LGWHQADPTELAAPGFHDKARRYLEALGGRDTVLETARQAIADQDHGWAMELLTHAVRVDTSDTQARRLKADAMRKWALHLSISLYLPRP
jgi:alkyl sulfatase BDS1-like metallo-beta-lactamase superfamily hydrolase